MKLEEAVATVRLAPPEQRKDIISRLLRGTVNHETSSGKTLATQRALFCSRLADEKLWPER